MGRKPRRETIGEAFLSRERWDCDECQAEFELGDVVFDHLSGLSCPHCKSARIGPKRDQASN